MFAKDISVQVAKKKNTFQNFFESLFKEKRSDTTLRGCLHISSQAVSAVIIDKKPKTLKIISAKSLDYQHNDQLPNLLSNLSKDFYLIPTYWLLSPEDYQLFLIESMPVSKEEFREALNWRVRSLISYPAEEAIIDYFIVPAKAMANKPMTAAIVAKSIHLSKTINLLRKSGFNLTTIDIPELALRNLTSFYEDDEKSSALIYFYSHLIILNITCKKTLYFTRRINLPLEEIQPQDYEAIGLDILRYFDYFQSQWRIPSPQRIFVAAEKISAEEIANHLTKQLMINVLPFSLQDILPEESKITNLHDDLLLSLGGTLRQDENYVETGD